MYSCMRAETAHIGQRLPILWCSGMI